MKNEKKKNETRKKVGARRREREKERKREREKERKRRAEIPNWNRKIQFHAGRPVTSREELITRITMSDQRNDEK